MKNRIRKRALKGNSQNRSLPVDKPQFGFPTRVLNGLEGKQAVERVVITSKHVPDETFQPWTNERNFWTLCSVVRRRILYTTPALQYLELPGGSALHSLKFVKFAGSDEDRDEEFW